MRDTEPTFLLPIHKQQVDATAAAIVTTAAITNTLVDDTDAYGDDVSAPMAAVNLAFNAWGEKVT